MDKKYILVYGSLRKGAYNYDRFKDHYGENFNYLFTIQIEGFDLYDISYGAYPGIKRNPAAGELTVDVIEVSSDCYDEIHEMEYHAGYTPVYTDIIHDDTGYLYNCTMYIFDGPVKAQDHIPSGNWIKYKLKNSEE